MQMNFSQGIRLINQNNGRGYTDHYYAGGKTDDCNSDLH